MDYRDEFDKIVSKAITRYADQVPAADTYGGKRTDGVFLRLGLVRYKNSNRFDNRYEIFIPGEPDLCKPVTFLDVLGVKFDLKMYSAIVPRFIRRVLLKMGDYFQISPDSVNVLCAFRDEKVHLFLYNGHSKIKNLDDAEIFSEEAEGEVMQEQMRELEMGQDAKDE